MNMKVILQRSAAVLFLITTCAWGYAANNVASSDAQPPAVRTIKVDSKRYEFLPNHLVMKKGETVDIELTTQDVVMGFNVPSMNVRATIVPGQVIHVRLTPQSVGTFDFLCDVFCGSGHEDMNGSITVVE